MKFKVITGIVLALFLIGMLTLAFNIQPVKASGTIYIRSDGSVEPDIAPISSVDNVTYTFTDNIYDPIVVERSNIIIDGAGYTLQGTGFYPSKGYCIYSSDISNVTIKNTNIIGFYFGVYLNLTSHNVLSENNITNNECGIILGYSNYTTISGNDITNNDGGIEFWNFSKNNIISGNNIAANDGSGIGLTSSSNNIISRNDITNNGGGIGLHSSSNNIISGNNITNNDHCGISVFINAIMSSNNIISGNNITNNDDGILLGYSSNNVLRNNTMVGNRLNFEVWGDELSHFVQDVDSSNTVDEKPIYYWINRRNTEVPSDAGYVALVNSYNITVKGSELQNNWRGILLANTTNSQITNNTISNNEDGITMYFFSNNNEIVNNTVSNNYLNGICLSSSMGNMIYHNNFINNIRQVYSEHGLTNTWDNGYPSGGNYWSDHTGVDLYSGPYQNETGSDGIGDTSYIIYTFGEERGRDRYPLMYPLGLPIAPRAIFSCSPSTPTTNETVTFNASPSVPGWNSTHKVPIANYTWDFGDGTSPVTETDPITTHNYTAVGTYTVNLTVMCQDDPVLIAQGLTLSPITVEEIQVIPEFPTWTSILLLLTVLSVVIAIYKRRLLKTLIH